MENLINMTTPEYIRQWVVVAILAVLALYAVWPKGRAILERWRSRKNGDDNLIKKVDAHEAEIKKINEKLERDYIAINEVKHSVIHQKKISDESLEEREIIMRSLLAILKCLQDVGDKDTTREAQSEIEDYINRQAHAAHKE